MSQECVSEWSAARPRLYIENVSASGVRIRRPTPRFPEDLGFY